jgi:hypothetical protein
VLPNFQTFDSTFNPITLYLRMTNRNNNKIGVINVDQLEDLNTEYTPTLADYPYEYDENRKMVVCPRGTTYFEMKEIKTDENKHERRMRYVEKGISQVKI